MIVVLTVATFILSALFLRVFLKGKARERASTFLALFWTVIIAFVWLFPALGIPRKIGIVSLAIFAVVIFPLFVLYAQRPLLDWLRRKKLPETDA